MAVTPVQVARILSGLDATDDRTLRLAYDLYRASDVEPVDAALPSAPEGSFAYHLRSRALARQLGGCALLDGTLARANGVVMGEGHNDLRCSHRSCSFKTCPVAMAACFSLYRRLDPTGEAPVLSAIEKREAALERRGRQFVEKWRPLTVGSEHALRLLVSERENDFAGAVVADDESYRADFVSDVAALLAAMGKVDAGAVRSVRATSLVNRVDPDALVFRETGDDNLAPRTLYVVDRLGDFEGLQAPRQLKEFVLERLGHIVDDRYVLLVGSRSEVARFMGLSAAFHFTYEKNRIELGYMAPEQVFESYLGNLDDELRIEAGGSDEFRARFCSFVAFNADALPFKGRELADYLAKGANATGRLELPESRYQSSSLDEMLDQIVGLDDVKATMRRLERFAIFRKTAAGRGAKLPPANFHMLFTGSPGTGKTTVARMVATMLYKIGITRQATCKEVTAKDLIGEYVGHTAPKTAKVVSEALGGVLFIDEAYALAGGKGETSGADYGAEAVAELIKLMEDHRDDLIVIFAGYEREMADFVDSNPGISSRIGYRFRFDDYTTDELIQIFRHDVSAAGLTYDEAAADPILRETFDYHRRFRSFGNGRFVGTLVQKALVKHATRVADDAAASDALRLTAADLPTRQELFDVQNWEPRPAEELLAPLVGMDDLKRSICALEQVVSYHERCARAGLSLPPLNLNMVLTGNPGTGKTTVARIIGQVLYNVGVVPTDRFVEVEAKDLVSTIVGGSSRETEKAIESAMGGVLFIDEAYGLLESHDGAEVIAQLVKAMEDHKGELSVMLAGYQAEMRRFVDLNPGLASRVGYTFHFEDYSVDELEQIFERKMASCGLEPDEGARAAARELFRYFHNVERFGNGRFVDKVIQEVIARRAGSGRHVPLAYVSEADVPSVEELCKVVSMPVLAPNGDFSDDALRRVAVHEMGHAACRLALVGETNIMVVTIEREATGTLGYVQHRASASELPTAAALEARMAELMGGMAAERLVLGDYSAGNSSDLGQATALARDYVARFGMSEAGYVQYVGDTPDAATGPAELPREVRDEMNEVMRRGLDLAQETVRTHRAAFDRLVKVLLAERTISGERITQLWDEFDQKGGA